ncbi:MAG: lysylphosphatidylglycerol synthase domain-containing protein [Candidatus Omnitrophica bacterium]|nr:lysylphosphatidylglycerol synthase domain-containing protein [Candidatus Omnitrophota bacterium]
MFKNALLIFFVLLATVVTHTSFLWIILKKKISYWQAFKSICLIFALNKLLLTGSGYAMMSWKLRYDKLDIAESISSFLVFEFFSLLPWLILGFYFGAKITVSIPIFLWIFLLLVLLFIYIKRKTAVKIISASIDYLKTIKSNLIFTIPFMVLNMFLSLYYYHLLMGIFRKSLFLPDILRIISIAITVGYLSPVPSGLGFKETSLVLLFRQKGLSWEESSLIAITDRLIITFFYANLGIIFAYDLIKTVLSSKRKKA